MNDTRKRDQPASAMTKREAVAALAYFLKGWDIETCILAADDLFDVLETPPELRDHDDFDHEGHP